MSLGDSGTAAAIECIGISRRIGNATVVDDVSLTVAQGETYVLLGANGAGKSSLLEVLSTLYPPNSGSIRIFGFNAAEQARVVRQRIGVVFQRTTLDERLTARENLRIHAALHRLSRAETEARVHDALKGAELEPEARRTVREFSGGMKRRLEIARALLHRPRLLLLDEPTAGLDPQSRQALWTRVAELSRQGLAVFATTHDLTEAARCQRVGVLANARLIAEGPPDRLGLESGADMRDLERAYLRLTDTRAPELRTPEEVAP